MHPFIAEGAEMVALFIPYNYHRPWMGGAGRAIASNTWTSVEWSQSIISVPPREETMKQLLLGTIAFFAFMAVNAMADQPVRPVYYYGPAYMPVYNWSGLYVGVQAGYVWARDSDVETVTGTHERSYYSPSGDAYPEGALIGGYVGYNWQISRWVFGIEADSGYMHAKDSTSFDNSGSPPDSYETTIGTQGAVRGRIGYSFGPTLLYAAGGPAFAHIKEHYVLGASGESSEDSKTQGGFTMGTGLDFLITDFLIGRVEYRYADFGTFKSEPDVFSGYTEHHDITENAVYFGIAYKFW
jgi:outer membrane immunogenic protein